MLKDWTPAEKTAAVIGGIIVLPLTPYAFIAGGMFVGGATGGILAIPGAIVVPAAVIMGGALTGRLVCRLLIKLLRR